ncbi:MAG: TonB family protein [Burkholderiales bacterium]
MQATAALVGRGALWARPEHSDRSALPLWKAAVVAALLEVLLPVLVFGVNWSFLPMWEESQPIKVMTVDLREPPREEPPPPPPERLKQVERKLPSLPIELPKPLPGEKPSKIQLPEPVEEVKPKPEVKLDPEPGPEPEKEPEPAPEPEPEAPPLPSVFQEVKPVKKVRIKYPTEAESQHIQGRVKVRLTVSAEGRVTDAEVLLSEPPGVFDEAVLEGVRQYQFKKDGTSYKAEQEVVFKIDG